MNMSTTQEKQHLGPFLVVAVNVKMWGILRFHVSSIIIRSSDWAFKMKTEETQVIKVPNP